MLVTFSMDESLKFRWKIEFQTIIKKMTKKLNDPSPLILGKKAVRKEG